MMTLVSGRPLWTEGFRLLTKTDGQNRDLPKKVPSQNRQSKQYAIDRERP